MLFRSLAPEKDVRAIRRTMGRLRLKLDEAKPDEKSKTKPPRFAPAGQSTQMIVGADDSNDQTILATSANLYGAYRPSAFITPRSVRSRIQAARCRLHRLP